MVRLEGIADNCRLNEEAARSASLEPADTVEVQERFILVCTAAAATVRVTATRTAGTVSGRK